LAEVTGLSTELQRVWRRRDQLPVATGSPARFNAKDAAEVLVRYELSRNGLPPGESGALSAEVAPSVLWFALLSADGACEIFGEEATVTAFLEHFENSDEIARDIPGMGALSRFVWRADGGEMDITNDRQNMGEEGDYLSVFYMDLATAGVLLANRIGHPLVTVEMSMEGAPPGKRIRRLTGRREADSS